MSAWPLAYVPLIDGYQEAPPLVAIRTEMEMGPAKQRRRYTAAARPITASVMLRSKADVTTLDTFYVTTLQGGVLPFDWTDRNGVTRSFRFVVGPDALTFQPVDPTHWRATMRLEILP